MSLFTKEVETSRFAGRTTETVIDWSKVAAAVFFGFIALALLRHLLL